MKRILLIMIIVASINSIFAVNNNPSYLIEVNQDSLRLLALDNYWKELSRTVREGDFEGYAAAYHEDAVVIFATGKNKTSMSITKALANWKQGFDDTKSGKNKSDVTFRFSQRIGDETTAHETGIFKYWSSDSNGENQQQAYVHFEMLFVKKDGNWLGVMEYQKSQATKEEWDALND